MARLSHAPNEDMEKVLLIPEKVEPMEEVLATTGDSWEGKQSLCSLLPLTGGLHSF